MHMIVLARLNIVPDNVLYEITHQNDIYSNKLRLPELEYSIIYL